MMIKNKKVIFSIALILITIFAMSTISLAVNPNTYAPNQKIKRGSFLTRAGVVLGWIKYVGILISVVVLTIIGIKYMFGSVEAKAEYKKTMLPYILGCFLLVGITVVIGIIEKIAKV